MKREPLLPPPGLLVALLLLAGAGSMILPGRASGRARPPGHAALPLRIDMGISDRPTHGAATCTADTHSPGFAWAYGMVRDVNRAGEPDSWYGDFVEGEDATFLVAVEPAESTYTVRLTLGDPARRRGPVTVMLNDRVVRDGVVTEPGRPVEITGETPTRNGWIEVRLKTDDCSGFALNGLEISGPDTSWIGDLFPPEYRNRPLPKAEELPDVGPDELRGLLAKMSDYLIRSAPRQGGFSYHGTWYQNAYPVRMLLAAGRILNEPRYAEPALICLDRFVARQLRDGNWLSNYFGTARCDTLVMPDSSANLADIGTMTLCLAIAAHQCDGTRRARYLAAARTYADSVSLPNQLASGAFPNGRWGPRKFSFPYTVATATQTASLAALYVTTHDARYLAAARKGAHWLTAAARPDGTVLLHPFDSATTRTKESTDFGDMFYVADALIWTRQAAAKSNEAKSASADEASAALNQWLLGEQGVLSKTLNGYWFQPQDPWGNSKMGGIVYVLACQARYTHDPVLVTWLGRTLAWLSDPERSRTIGVMEHPASQIGAYALTATGFAGLGVAAALDPSAVFPAE